jgi:hypothetical protein
MSIYKRNILILVALITHSGVFGQAARSPFTTFGIGEPYGSALINAQGMGGVGVSQPQFWYLNNQNPALLVYNNLTVFQAGMLVESRNIRRDTARERSTGGNMNYLVTAFPVKPNRWTTSLGLMPYTTVKYSIQYEDVIENSTGKVHVREEGSGGLTQLYWSNGVRLSKELAVGIKSAYIFSSVLNTYQTALKDFVQPVNYIAAVQERSYVKDFSFAAGLSFSKDSLFSQKKYRFSAGAVYNFSTDLKTRQRHLIYRTLSGLVEDDPDPDTVISSSGAIHIPSGITAGISLSRGTKWTIGTEFSYQDWTTFRSVNVDDEGLGKSWRVAAGGEMTPDAISDKYLRRITYRLGLSYERTPYLVDRSDNLLLPDYRKVNDLGINFGFSLPAGRSSLDFAFKYGKRGNRTETIFEEDYFKVYFGLTFNDQWFIKRKFD